MSQQLLLRVGVVAGLAWCCMTAQQATLHGDPLPTFLILASLLVLVAMEAAPRFVKIPPQRKPVEILPTIRADGPEILVSAMEIARMLEVANLELDRFAELQSAISRQVEHHLVRAGVDW